MVTRKIMRVVAEENKKKFTEQKVNEQMISFLFIDPYFNQRKLVRIMGESPKFEKTK